jgi:alpha-glucosidase (family GH31 glycosyl hydrolase)
MSLSVLLMAGSAHLLAGTLAAQGIWNPVTGIYELSTPNYQMTIDRRGFRFGFSEFGAAPINPHADHGMAFGGSPIETITSVRRVGDYDEIRVQAANGTQGSVTVHALENAVRFHIRPDEAAHITTQTGGLSNAPAYGLADAAATRPSTNLTGRTYEAMKNDAVINRFASSFLIHPSRRFAGVSFYPSDTTIEVLPKQYSITTRNTGGAGDFQDIDIYYFLGDIPDIYSAYRSARTTHGYPDVFPQSRLFELGWESWDRLRANANGEAVRNAVQEFLDQGYPIKWLVTGSGYWQPRHLTTSFGYLDQRLGEYPDTTGPIGPAGAGFATWTDQQDLAWLIGQRTDFVTPRVGVVDGYVEGPFTQEANELGYFVNDLDGTRFVITTSWAARTPTWILDGTNPGAAAWFQKKFDLWKAFGIDGVKEDTGATDNFKRTDVFNGLMSALAESGSLVMARNGAFTMPGTLHRINDTWGDFSNRAAITWLQYAASGAPNVYADSIGYSYVRTDPARTIRNAWVQSLTAGMTFSDSPWAYNWSQAELAALRKAVEFRHAITPYIYSAAVDSYDTGFPHTLTPLYLAFPDDPNTYNLANTTTDRYEWMVGPSILAAPLFESSGSEIDIYLPPGQWIDYNTGAQYTGGQTLPRFTVPIDQPPIFIGGKGILIQRSRDELTLAGEIYPVSPSGVDYTFTHMDGVSKSTISTNHSLWNPAQMRIIDLTSGHVVPFEVNPVTGALRFQIEPDRNYRLLSLAHLPGDFDQNGLLDVLDLERLHLEIALQANRAEFDLDGDRFVDGTDLVIWVKDLKRTWVGDANLDLEFTSDDLIMAFVAGSYELDVDAGWAQGDWTGDLRFDSSDLIAAFADGGYELGPRTSVQAVPEPPASVLLATFICSLANWEKRMRRVDKRGRG